MRRDENVRSVSSVITSYFKNSISVK